VCWARAGVAERKRCAQAIGAGDWLSFSLKAKLAVGRHEEVRRAYETDVQCSLINYMGLRYMDAGS
jgi:hypothetical protein